MDIGYQAAIGVLLLVIVAFIFIKRRSGKNGTGGSGTFRGDRK